MEATCPEGFCVIGQGFLRVVKHFSPLAEPTCCGFQQVFEGLPMLVGADQLAALCAFITPRSLACWQRLKTRSSLGGNVVSVCL